MPVVSLFQAFHAAIDAVKNALLFVLNVPTLAWSQAVENFGKTLGNMAKCIYFAFHAVMDPLFELTSLATRSTASVASGIGSLCSWLVGGQSGDKDNGNTLERTGSDMTEVNTNNVMNGSVSDEDEEEEDRLNSSFNNHN